MPYWASTARAVTRIPEPGEPSATRHFFFGFFRSATELIPLPVRTMKWTGSGKSGRNSRDAFGWQGIGLEHGELRFTLTHELDIRFGSLGLHDTDGPAGALPQELRELFGKGKVGVRPLPSGDAISGGSVSRDVSQPNKATAKTAAAVSPMMRRASLRMGTPLCHGIRFGCANIANKVRFEHMVQLSW